MEAEEEEQAAYRARNKTFLKAEAAAAAAVTAAENASNGSGSVSDNSSGSPLCLQPTVPTPPLMTGKEAAGGGEGEEEEDAGSGSPVLDALRTETREVRTARRQAEADTRFASFCVCVRVRSSEWTLCWSPNQTNACPILACNHVMLPRACVTPGRKQHVQR